MAAFLTENLSTILISLVLLVVVGLIIAGMVKDHKAGKTVCGGCSGCSGCSGCPSAGMCHKKS